MDHRLLGDIARYASGCESGEPGGHVGEPKKKVEYMIPKGIALIEPALEEGADEEPVDSPEFGLCGFRILDGRGSNLAGKKRAVDSKEIEWIHTAGKAPGEDLVT